MKCAQGICIHCETVIAKRCTDCGLNYKPLENYTTIKLAWSNGSEMTMPVCIPCSKGPIWNCDKKELTQAIWNEWDRVNGKYDKGVVIV